MNYSELIETMHQYRAGGLTRTEMIAAIALWQRPVEVVPAHNKKAVLEAVIR